MESLLIYLLKASALLSIFYLCYVLLLRKETSFQLNRKFLLGGLIISGFLPAIYFTKKVYIQASAQPFDFIMDSSEVTIAPVENTTDWWEIAAVAYLIVTGFFLLRLSIQLFSVFNILISNRFRKIAGLKYLETSANQLPFSFFNYIIFNPEKHSQKDLELILDHERVHARQVHSFDILIANVVSCILWFNPFAWLYKKTIEENLEFIADRETVKNNTEIKEYQKALVKVSIADLRPALTNHFYQSFIKKRILMLNKKSSTHSPAWKLSLVMPLLLAFMLLFNVKTEAMILPAQKSIQEPEPKEETETEQDVEVAASTDPEVLAEQDEIRTVEVISDDEPGKVHVIEVPNRKRINPLQKLGNDPLYIINGKEYKSSKLKNKYIGIENQFNVFTGDDATDRYGDAAKNGVVIIPNGIISKNFKPDMNEIRENLNLSKSYLFIDENGKLNYLKLSRDENTSNSIGSAKEKVLVSKSPGLKTTYVVKNKEDDVTTKIIGYKTSTLNSKIYKYNSEESDTKSNKGEGINFAPQNEDPLYVVDDEIMGEGFIDSIDPNEIASIHVFKGENAIRKYGKKARNGAILIKTKTASIKLNDKIFMIQKTFDDQKLEALKKDVMAKTGYELELKDIKRDNNGEITDISVKFHKENQMVQSNYSNTNGIPKIYVGIQENGGLIISSD